jgi:acyl carrier protein
MKERVLRVVGQIMEVPESSLSLSSSPDTVLEWDSLRHMNLVLALEEEFEVQFTDQQIVQMVSIAKILEALEEL